MISWNKFITGSNVKKPLFKRTKAFILPLSK